MIKDLAPVDFSEIDASKGSTPILGELRSRRSAGTFDITEAARDVIVIAISARSGSSWLVELLKQSPDAVHLRGEVTTLLRLHGLSYPTVGTSEALDAGCVDLVPDAFRHDLSLEAGWPTDQIDNADNFYNEVLWRLRLQWPNVSLPSDISSIIAAEFEKSNACSQRFDTDLFTRSLALRLKRDLGIDPGYYDLGVEPVANDNAMPWARLLESPPFLRFLPWRAAAKSDLIERPLIIKSVGDPYRLSFYRTLFPNARLRVIHLRRNPAASINGLIDGWLSRTYQSFKVGDLSIKGYSDGNQAWRREWWKFDLPPGWQNFRNASLNDVCAWQWSSAQNSILDWLDETKCDHAIVRYEDMIGSGESLQRTISTLCKWIGIRELKVAETRNVNAIVPPSHFRWKKRETEIMDIVKRDENRQLATRLGYSMNPDDWP